MKSVMEKEGKTFFESWFGCCPSLRIAVLWNLGFFAITWSIWLHRNEVIFNGKVFNSYGLLDMAILKAGWWIHSKFPETGGTLTDLISNPALWSGSLPQMVGSSRSVWDPPPLGSVKFNTNGQWQAVSDRQESGEI
ncbi:hypothetical protein V6N12_007751 [Hibiscus sabdariffa]|uniref:Uncharacterized protein n=1 Tax=Hibiscus sabdariffa TaxID=183260 RepID=A0ABR2F2N1_9ROSI